MMTGGLDGGLAEDWVCSHAHVASEVRMREGSGREEYTVPLWAVTDVTGRRIRATLRADGLLLGRRGPFAS